MLLALILAQSASAATSSVRFSADPTEDKPVTVTVSGSTETARSLFVKITANGTCASTPDATPATWLSSVYGDYISAGSYSRTYSYTPTAPGTYRVCTWVDQSSSGAQDASAQDTLSVANDPSDDPPARPVESGDGESDSDEISPAPPVAILGPAARVTQSDRRPVFRWQPAEGYTDQLIIEDEDGEPLTLVRDDGTYAPTDEDDEDVVDWADYDDDSGDDLSDAERTTFDQWYLEKIANQRIERNAGVAEVRLDSALPPGRYRWFVERSLDGRVVPKAAEFHLTLLGPPLKRLKVHARSRANRSSAHPGQTTLQITTTPFANVRISIARSGRERIMRYAWDASARGDVTIDWTCKLRGAGHYRWSVTATDPFGKVLLRKGRFKTVTKTRCAAYRAAERAAARQRAAARARREAAERRAAALAAAREYRRKAGNCAALNGHLRRLNYADGSSSLVCVTPNGFFAPP
jgi:hypothetical protein